MDLAPVEAAARLPFNGSPRPTFGVELELQVIDPVTCNLKSGSTEILGRLDDHPGIKQELTQSTVEVITGICNTVAEARTDLAGSLREDGMAV